MQIHSKNPRDRSNGPGAWPTEWSVDVDEPTDPGPERQGSDPIQPEMCCDCGYLTYEPVKVGEAYATGGAGRDVFACPRHAPQYLVGGAS